MFRGLLAVVNPTVGDAVNTSFEGLVDQAWVVIPGGLLIFGLIYGIGVVKKAGKKAAA